MAELQKLFGQPNYSEMGFLEKLGHTWPARTLADLFTAVKLPGEVYAGQQQVFDPSTGRVSQDLIGRTADLAGALTLGAGAVPATRNTLRAGASLPKKSLPMDQASRMQRARDMGFDVDNPVYHGTDKSFDKFRSSERGKLGAGVYFTPNVKVANKYSGDAENAQTIKAFYRGKIAPTDIKKEVSERVRKKMRDEGVFSKPGGILSGTREWKDRTNIELKNMGYSGIQAADEILIFDPSNIRSVNAKFDPAKKNSGNILAGGAGAAVLATGMGSGEAEASNNELGDILAKALQGRL